MDPEFWVGDVFMNARDPRVDGQGTLEDDAERFGFLGRFSAAPDVVGEKYQASEEGVAPIRFMVALFTGLMFAFVRGPEPIAWLAVSVIGIAVVYSAWVLWARPYEKHAFMESSLFLSASDLTLISLFLVATGGFGSPYFPLWYLSVFALSLRFGVGETLVGASVYTVAYAGVAAMTDGLLANLPTFLVRCGYIYLAGLLGIMASSAVSEEMVERRRFQHISRRLQDTMDDLRGSLSIQEATFDATADGLLVVDTDQNVVASNERFQEMWDLPKQLPSHDEALITRALDQVEDPTRFMERIDDVYDDPGKESFDEIRFKDGRVFERYSRPQRIGGEIVGRVWSFRDVTDKRRAWDELEKTHQDLQRYADAAAEELEFAHAAAHDLKEPARMVQNYLTLLQDHVKERLDEDAQGMLDYASDGAQQMQDLVDGLLAFSRIDARRTTMEPVEVDQVLERVLSALTLRIEETNATIIQHPLPTVQADEAHLSQIFQNLITNAIKFSKPDTPPRIHIGADPEGGMQRIWIQDNGIGMDPDQATDLFKLFQRGEAKPSIEGQGIGLAICKKIIDHHGGRIDVDTEPGAGTTFSFTLPTPNQQPRPRPEHEPT